MRNPYPNFVWFVGIAEQISGDPLKLGRVRVRAVGFHPSAGLETDQLPWAPVLNGGAARIKSGQMVLGFFLDGEEAQQPCIMGVIGGAVTGSNFINILRKSGTKSVSEAPVVPPGAPNSETAEEEAPDFAASENKTVRVFEAQSKLATYRIYPISSRLKRVLETAAEKADLFVVVFSGGQTPDRRPPKASVRHDNGNAADIYLYYPDPANPKQRGPQRLFSSNGGSDLQRIQLFLREAVAAGALGIGHGPGYMGSGGGATHVDVYKKNRWGAGNTILNAPSWLKNL